MNITKIFFIIALPSLMSAHSIMAKKPSQKKLNPQNTGAIEGPKNNLKSVCPICPNFTCPVSPTAITGCTGPACTSGCSGNSASFCCLIIDNLISETSSNITSAAIDGNVVVSLNADIKNDLSVEEQTTIAGNVCIEDNKNVSENVTIDGFAVVLGTLSVGNGLSVSGNLVENGNQTLNSSVIVNQNQGVSGAIRVGSTGQINGFLTTSEELSVYNGSTINSGGLTIENPSGCTGCTGALINGDVSIIGNLIVGTDVTVTDKLTIDENMTFNNLVIGTGATLITNSTVTLNDGLTITGDETVISGSKIIGSDLSVSETTTLEQLVTINNGAILNDGIVITGGVLTDNLMIPNGSLNVSGTLRSTGAISSLNGVSSLKDLTITDTLNSNCPAGPASLVIDGGLGIGATGPATGVIGRDLWIGGSDFFTNVSNEDGVPTGFDYYEESCFSTAFTWGGMTVSPPASVLIKLIRVGNIVNLLIPAIIYNNAGTHISVITASTAIPSRFRPFVTVRGPASTIISFSGATGAGALGEFDISPAGIITLGLPGSVSGPLGSPANALGPQSIQSSNYVQADINTITYNINGCSSNCKRPCP